MGRIEAKFKTLKEKGEKALVVYLTAGCPNLEATLEMIPSLEKAGADIIELGVPFSDPTADGPVIQASSQKALKNGTTLANVLNLVSEVRKFSEVPIVLFGYYNPIFAYGNENFAKKASEVGVDGILVVDLPFEEADELRHFTDPRGIDLIALIAPTTGKERIRRIAAAATGFLYFVSITGVTGTLKPAVEDIRRGVERIREISSLPTAIGFGISAPTQAAEIAAFGDGIVVGSALMQKIEAAQGKGPWIPAVSSFVMDLKKALLSSAT